MITCRIEIKMEGCRQLENELRTGVISPEIDTALKQWSARMRAFLKARFIRESKGGADWAPLAASTVARRRKGKKVGRSSMILRDTGTLLAALGPTSSAPGSLNQIGPGMSITVGFGGSAKHPGSSGRASIADIAEYHQVGGKHLPKREVVVGPDQHTLDLMQRDMVRAINKRAKRLIGE